MANDLSFFWSYRAKQVYVSPSDTIMSPCTAKLSAYKSKQFGKYVFLSFPILSFPLPPLPPSFTPHPTPLHSIQFNSIQSHERNQTANFAQIKHTERNRSPSSQRWKRPRTTPRRQRARTRTLVRRCCLLTMRCGGKEMEKGSEWINHISKPKKNQKNGPCMAWHGMA